MERVPTGLCDRTTSLYCSFPRRDGRVAEGARLESVYTGNRIVGSNPTPSAKTAFAFVRRRPLSHFNSSRFRASLFHRRSRWFACTHESFVGQVVGTGWADTWMPVTGKLTALKVAREKRPGLYGDGGGLYLQVTTRGSKSWIFRFCKVSQVQRGRGNLY